MTRRILWVAAALAMATCAASAAGAAEKLSYVDLVKRLTDLERLAVLPEPGTACAQWSSYDRASKFNADTGKYERWDANDDGPGIIRREGDTEVFAEMTGPGCIWRIWSAKADGGHVRIYLDGAETPAVDLPFKDYFSGSVAPFVYPSLVHMTARGINNYVPIPYAKSCKIVGDKGWGRYFQFVYETFPEGTQVPTFKRDLSADETAALAAADEMLTRRLGQDPAGPRAGEKTITQALTVEPGKTAAVAALDGAGAITALRVKMDTDDPALRDALRQLAIRITFDGAAEPAVWSPLGDFFGTAPGYAPYRSLPLGMTADEFYCLWYMPYAQGAKVEITNDGDAARALSVTLTHAPLSRPAEALGRFHAKWHRDALLPPEPERKIDWTMLKTVGRGRFCGVMLHVWNPRGGWWGEGDEKFFVDGEKFPSTIGTGSEDYFGYAWCCPDLFQNAYHNQPYNDGNNKGHVAVNRWHVADNIPFQKSFEGAIEKYYPNAKPTLYAATVYWYLAPGGEDPYAAAPVAERTGYFVAPEIPKIKGAMEGEQLKVLKCTGGQIRPQDMSHYEQTWSNESQAWWTNGKVGDRLDLALPVAKAGKYKVVVALTKAIDYGIIQPMLDDKPLGDAIDCWNDGVISTGPVVLGTRELEAGQHTFSLVITGANPKMKPGYMAGLDYVKLEAVE